MHSETKKLDSVKVFNNFSY